MSKYVKYHDNTQPGLGYGADGKLLDNWDPDRNYFTEYANVFFRINCPLYMRGASACSFDSEADHLSFCREVEKVFVNLGWKVEVLPNGGRCMEVSKGKQRLYLHPQTFSGCVWKNEVRKIAEALFSNETFSLEWVDIYETVYDLTDYEYEQNLLRKKEEARRLILAVAQTPQRKFFKDRKEVERAVSIKIRLFRVGDRNLSHSLVDEITLAFSRKLVDELIGEGLIIQEGPGYIRSANKTEMRRVKKPVA